MPRKYLNLDDLLLFCKKNNFNHFSANESGGPIIVQTPGRFELNGDTSTGLLPVKLYACHTNTNRNGSSISKSAMEAALPSFSNRPILGYIHQLEDGTWDFYSHNMEVVEDENEKDGARIDYLETPVGIIPESCNAHLEYDEENDVYRTCVNGFVFEEYSKAGDILRAKGISNVSVEIAINDMSYNSDDGYLSINDFYFMGVTILGRDEEGNIVEPGMAGSNITLGSFSAENNSMLNNDIHDTLVETLKKLNETLEKFNDKNNSDKKGGEDQMNKFEELLELYELTAEEIEFEVEGLSDEDLEAAFNEAFGDAEEFKKKKKKCSEENPDNDEDEDFAGCGTKKKKKKCSEEEENENEEEFAGCGGKKKKKRCSINTEDNTIEFELSFDEIRMALYSLINGDTNEDSYSWICEVYDGHFVYQKESWTGDTYECKYYKQNYSKDGDNVSLSGDAVEVFSTFVTESERTALDMMRTQYEELKKFHDDTIAAQEQSQKDEIFNDEKYSILAENEKFAELKKDSAKFSVSEIEEKCKVIFAEEVMAKGNYSVTNEKSGKTSKKIGFNFNEKPKKAQAYAGLFND